MKDIAFVTIKSDGSVVNKLPYTKMVVSGKEKLVHEIIRVIYTSIGTNQYDTNYGSNFTHLIESSFENEFEARNLIMNSINQVETSIKINQLGQDLPPEERLDRLELMELNFLREGEIRINLRVITEANESITLTL